jgi:CHAT domain-containing protein
VQAALLKERTGLIYPLHDENAPVPIDALFALWQALVPPQVRSALLDSSLKRLMIIPDATLALLPFEALVVDPAAGPRYLLDVDVPVAYAPSATVLAELTQASSSSGLASLSSARGADQREPVLSVAKWDYSDRPGWRPLDYTAGEASAVGVRFQNANVPIRQIENDQATEGRVRSEISDRRLVHLACHGESERPADRSEGQQDYGNLLGRLVLTPESTEPSNDGDLTLPEIYELNLKGCELVLLSACKTNYGPTLRGEGVFALTRGFLTAGTRRVMTTQWNVNDESTAYLVNAFYTFLLRNREAAEEIDYAALLHKAKQYVRKHEGRPGRRDWERPQYWAPMVLVGPY